jgi:hypothetical protein
MVVSAARRWNRNIPLPVWMWLPAIMIWCASPGLMRYGTVTSTNTLLLSRVRICRLWLSSLP